MLELLPVLAAPAAILATTIAVVAFVGAFDTGKRGRAARRTLEILVRLHPPKQ